MRKIRKTIIVSTEKQKSRRQDALEKSNYALIRELKQNKASLENSKIGLCAIKQDIDDRDDKTIFKENCRLFK